MRFGPFYESRDDVCQVVSRKRSSDEVYHGDTSLHVDASSFPWTGPLFIPLPPASLPCVVYLYCIYPMCPCAPYPHSMFLAPLTDRCPLCPSAPTILRRLPFLAPIPSSRLPVHETLALGHRLRGPVPLPSGISCLFLPSGPHPEGGRESALRSRTPRGGASPVSSCLRAPRGGARPNPPPLPAPSLGEGRRLRVARTGQRDRPAQGRRSWGWTVEVGGRHGSRMLRARVRPGLYNPSVVVSQLALRSRPWASPTAKPRCVPCRGGRLDTMLCGDVGIVGVQPRNGGSLKGESSLVLPPPSAPREAAPSASTRHVAAPAARWWAGTAQGGRPPRTEAQAGVLRSDPPRAAAGLARGRRPRDGPGILCLHSRAVAGCGK